MAFEIIWRLTNCAPSVGRRSLDLRKLISQPKEHSAMAVRGLDEHPHQVAAEPGVAVAAELQR
jgi:hypothetical protein